MVKSFKTKNPGNKKQLRPLKGLNFYLEHQHESFSYISEIDREKALLLFEFTRVN